MNAHSWTLLGIGVVVAGFALRINPLLVVIGAALTTGVASGSNPLAVLRTLGHAFNDSRYISVVWLVLPAIGVLERYGLQQHARNLIRRLRAATTGRLLLVYFLFRQLTAALGQNKLGGHPQMVRPLIAPMAEAAAESRFGEIGEALRFLIRAHAAAVDNIALFFGEDIFIAIASILLIKGFLDSNGITVEPLQVSVWAIPTAVAALLVHGLRLMWLDRELARRAGRAQS